MSTLAPYQQQFISFLLASSALTFGDFVTKSGRKTPYFVNTGNFNNGERIATLGKFYAAHIVAKKLERAQIIFGPAYKGIPLCVTTAAALFLNHSINCGFSFNRKEAKDHGDAGTIVGQQLKQGDRILIVEDVVTAGTTLREVVPLLQTQWKVEVEGVVIAVDRCERGESARSAVQEAQDSLGIKIFPLLTIHDILGYLSTNNQSGYLLTSELQGRIQQYLATYGAQ